MKMVDLKVFTLGGMFGFISVIIWGLFVTNQHFDFWTLNQKIVLLFSPVSIILSAFYGYYFRIHDLSIKWRCCWGIIIPLFGCFVVSVISIVLIFINASNTQHLEHTYPRVMSSETVFIIFIIEFIVTSIPVYICMSFMLYWTVKKFFIAK